MLVRRRDLPEEWPRLALLLLCGSMALVASVALLAAEPGDARALALIVAGANGTAAVLLALRHPHAPDLAAIAGALLAGWSLTEALTAGSMSAMGLPILLGCVTTALSVTLATARVDGAEAPRITKRRSPRPSRRSAFA